MGFGFLRFVWDEENYEPLVLEFMQIWGFVLSILVCRRLSTLSMEVPTVMDLVSLLSSCAALRQLAPWMLLSLPPARLACYARLLPTPWKRIKIKRTLGRRKLSIEERTLYNAKRSSQLGSQVGGLQMSTTSLYTHEWKCVEPMKILY